MSRKQIDILIEKIEKMENPTVVGLDPTEALMPPAFFESAMEGCADAGVAGRLDGFADAGDGVQIGGMSSQVCGAADDQMAAAMARAFLEFNKTVIDAAADIVPAVKPQIAMYEAYGPAGVEAYAATCSYAKEKGLTVIGDIKRGDILSTAAAYASHIGGSQICGRHINVWDEDFVTVNPYLGSDGIIPFTEVCAENGSGIFVLVKTSNPSSSELQDIDVGGDPLYMRMAELVQTWGSSLIGEHGYSSVGAVVGATHREVGGLLRNRFPQMFFLVPGYGAQGAGAEDLKGFFGADGRGCIVNSSRGIIGAWKKTERGADGGKALGLDEAKRLVASSVREAALRMKEELAQCM